MSAFPETPTVWSFFSPPLKKINVGMLLMPNWAAAAGQSSTFTFATVNLPEFSAAISSTTGVSIRHGAHHVAQKSKRTGVVAFLMNDSKSVSLSSVTCALDIELLAVKRVRDAVESQLINIHTCTASEARARTRAAIPTIGFSSSEGA